MVPFDGFVAGSGSAMAYSHTTAARGRSEQTSILDAKQTSYSNPHFDRSFALHRAPVIVEEQRAVRLGRLGGFERETN